MNKFIEEYAKDLQKRFHPFVFRVSYSIETHTATVWASWGTRWEKGIDLDPLITQERLKVNMLPFESALREMME